MQTFAYTVVNSEGKVKSGLIEAADESQAATILREQKLIITSLEAKRIFALSGFLKKFKKVPEEAKVVFARQLATMVAAGLTLSNALEILEKQTTNPYFKEIIGKMVRDIDGGLSFSKALMKYPDVFPRIFASLIMAGEASGSLDKILNRLADMMEQEHEFKAKTKGALIYPIIVMIAMGGVVAVLFIFVIPKLTTMYEQMSVDLPLPTKILIGSSKWAQNNWLVVIVILLVVFFLLRSFSKTVRGRYYFADANLKLPIAGKLSKQIQFGSISRTLSMLLGAGVPILESLDIIRETVGNIRIREAIAKTALDVEKGESIGNSMSKNPIFPPLFTQMILVGEKTGKIDEVLINVADYFENEAMHTTEGLSAAIEPLIIILLAVGAGFLIISIVLPIYKITTSF